MARVDVEIERCKGCALCVDACPEQVLKIGKEINLGGYQHVIVANPDDCTGCCRCAEMCPDVALAVWR